jgi:hypothetical protein
VFAPLALVVGGFVMLFNGLKLLFSNWRSSTLFIPGIIVVSLATTLQAGATGAVKAVKMSAKLLAPRSRTVSDVVPDHPPTAIDADAPGGDDPVSLSSPDSRRPQ